MGRLDVDRMLHEMSPAQFAEWFAYYLAEPWGAEWEIGGTIAAEVRNVVAEATGNDPRATPQKYIPTYLTRKQREAREREAEIQREFLERHAESRYLGGV